MVDFWNDVMLSVSIVGSNKRKKHEFFEYLVDFMKLIFILIQFLFKFAFTT